jgi:hypothetical protein
VAAAVRDAAVRRPEARLQRAADAAAEVVAAQHQ